MNVTVSCPTKFHAFHLAEQLDKRGCLHKFITIFYNKKRGWLPELRRDEENIDPNKVITNILPAFFRGLNLVPGIKNLTNWDYYLVQAFDCWARSQVDKCDIFVGWSGMSLHTLRKAKSYGVMTIVERGSSHILFQKEILEEEHEKYDIKIKPIDDRVVEKELLEYREADFISVPSRFVKQTFIKKGIDLKKIIQVPYGVNLSNFKQIPKEDKVFRIVFVGGLTLRKGVHYLLEVFSKLNLKNAELTLIGALSPEIKPFLKKYDGSYNYLGVIPHAQLHKYMSQGSAFILPSIEEGLAIVIPQAMACGLPVICTTNTGGEDIIQEGKEGFIIPIRDVNALKEKILYLYENEEKRLVMSNNALKRSREFTWDVYGEKIVQCYKEILKENS